MMTYEQVRELIGRQNTRNDCLNECYDALCSNELREVHSEAGRVTVRDALATFRIRMTTTKAAGVSTCGFEETLQTLGTRAAEETLLLFGFISEVKAFSIFVAEAEQSIVGCIRVTRTGAE
jgi:hypothetical protein